MNILTGKAPLRLTFVGGGTDIPSYYEKYGGMTIGCTIDKYVRVSVNSPEIPDITRVKTPWIKEYTDIHDIDDEFLFQLLEPLKGMNTMAKTFVLSLTLMLSVQDWAHLMR